MKKMRKNSTSLVALPVSDLIHYIVQGMSCGEIVRLSGASSSSVKQSYDRVIKRVMSDIDDGYDPLRDSNKTNDYINLRDMIRNKRIEEGFKNNLLYSIESTKTALLNMGSDPIGLVEKAKLLEKMNRQIIEIQKISKGK